VLADRVDHRGAALGKSRAHDLDRLIKLACADVVVEDRLRRLAR
jgi:hypothetical protein